MDRDAEELRRRFAPLPREAPAAPPLFVDPEFPRNLGNDPAAFAEHLYELKRLSSAEPEPEEEIEQPEPEEIFEWRMEQGPARSGEARLGKARNVARYGTARLRWAWYGLERPG